MKNKHLITIFTATYNRANLLLRLFKSLQKQSNFNFEWVIVDDGSTDNTTEVVSNIKKEANFSVNYQKQENQGKHIAINNGVVLANGAYFFIVDSDDKLPENAIEIISTKIKLIDAKDNVAGLIGLKCFFDKKVVGSNHFSEEIICDVFDYRYLHKVKGDRAEIFKTSILKKYPFPKFEEEKFVPESIVWNRIGQDYNMLFFNENVYECEYLEDGLSNNSVKLRSKYPKGVLQLYVELGNIKKIGLANRFKAYINFWRFFFFDISAVKQNLKRLHFNILALFSFPFGILIHFKDRLTQKKR